MTNIKFIDKNEDYFDPAWKDSLYFKTKIIGDQGQEVAKDYTGRRYRLIKQEREFSKWERFSRALQAIWIVLCSFFLEMRSKKVNLLFSKKYKSRRIAIPIKHFTRLFPKEINHKIFCYLNPKDLSNCLGVNEEWKIIAGNESLWNALIPEIAFGKKQWTTYFGDIGNEPPLPKNIHKILSSPCPFWPLRKVKETHILVLIPKTVNGESLTLETLKKLVKTPKEGNSASLSYIEESIIEEHGNQAIIESHWVLMTNDVIEGSRNKSYQDQEKLIAEFANQHKTNYAVPNILDAVICIFMHFIRSGEPLFSQQTETNTFTRCQEKERHGNQIIIGSFFRNTLSVYGCSLYSLNSSRVGVAALMKFFSIDTMNLLNR